MYYTINLYLILSYLILSRGVAILLHVVPGIGMEGIAEVELVGTVHLNDTYMKHKTSFAVRAYKRRKLSFFKNKT